ncbi:MAG: HlyD family efflux transporter periplasmic adaptor subunit [Lentimicrobiaceae bacterium]|nr:HlyD family efflux transporter periplasmic adaptor subunit [Lentimicrobiaceae bacterium]
MNKFLSFFLTFITIVSYSCKYNKTTSDAYGVFGATEITVSSESNGKMLWFDVQEGENYRQGEKVGCIDTVQIYLQIKQLDASIGATMARRPDLPSQVRTLYNKLETLNKERNRIATLVEANAASSKQLDDIVAEIDITNSQIAAMESNLTITNKAIMEEVEAMRFQKLQLQDALTKCHIKSPITGTVLKKYIEPNELAFQGKPLFKIADLANMFIKVYITEDMLSTISLGQPVDIHIDMPDNEEKTINGAVSWISSKAEFTPKMIQTKNERVNLVYAVKVSFKNDGSAKIGMPGDVKFK